MAKIVKTKVEFEGVIREEMAVVEEESLAPWTAKDRLVHVGRELTRVDGFERVTGRATFTTDLAFPGMLHARFVRSPLAHARVLSVDPSAALRLPGVRAVHHRGTLPALPWHDGLSYLFDEVVRHVGDEVALVVADGEEEAEAAARAVRVRYEVLYRQVCGK